jgi:hypothetical protein
VAAFCLAAFCASAFGTVISTVIDTYPDWDGNVTESYFKVAQSFLAPADNTLASWKFTLATSPGPTNILFEIVPWNASSGPSGSPLFSRTVSWSASGGDILVDNINLTLTPGSRYAAIVDLRSYGGPSVNFEYNQDSYNQGNAAWFAGINPTWKYLNSTYNTQFRAEFYAVPEPACLFAMGLVGIVFVRHLNRKKAH